MSNKRKKKELLARREEKVRKQEEIELLKGLRNGTVIAVDPEKIFSRSVLPDVPEYYYDTEFVCRDCGHAEVWTAKKQKQYYEEQGGRSRGRPFAASVAARRKGSAKLK